MSSEFNQRTPWAYLDWLNHSPAALEKRYTRDCCISILQLIFPGNYTLAWGDKAQGQNATHLYFKFYDKSAETEFKLRWL